MGTELAEGPSPQLAYYAWRFGTPAPAHLGVNSSWLLGPSWLWSDSRRPSPRGKDPQAGGRVSLQFHSDAPGRDVSGSLSPRQRPPSRRGTEERNWPSRWASTQHAVAGQAAPGRPGAGATPWALVRQSPVSRLQTKPLMLLCKGDQMPASGTAVGMRTCVQKGPPLDGKWPA